MSAIEKIALILVVLSAIKLVVVFINPRAWYHGPAKLWMKPGVAVAVALVLGVIVLRYLLVELSIVQIFATMGFASLVFMLVLAPYYRDLQNALLQGENSGAKIFRRSWLGTLAWIALMVWVVMEIFG